MTRINLEAVQKAVKAYRAANNIKTIAAKQLKIPYQTLCHRLKIAVRQGLISDDETRHRDYIGRQIEDKIAASFTNRINLSLNNGTILVGSDAHFWPGEASTAWRGFVKFARDIQPDVIVMNGDVMDNAGISRHPPIGHTQQGAPTVEDEIKICQERLLEIKRAAPKAKLHWTMGNHDIRFNTRLAMSAPEFAKIKGARIEDHFPDWQFSWSLFVNEDTVIKHRLRGGQHAAYNNLLKSGTNIITGHLHSLKVYPFTDYRFTRFGVDTGTLGDVGHQAEHVVHYLEDGPTDWRQGFVVLKYWKGKLLWPQIAHVIGRGLIDYCGEVKKV